MNVKHVWELLRDAGKQWLDNKAPRMGAALAYYTAFSLAPLLLLSIAIGGLMFGEAAVQGHIVGQIDDLVGKEGADAVQGMLANANNKERGIAATIIGIGLLIFGASGVFNELQDSLNTVWLVKPKPDRGIWGILQDRFLSFSMVMGCCFLLLVSLVVSAALTAVTRMCGLETGIVSHIINFVLSFGVITVLFAMIYRFLPDAVIAWRNVWLGAAITALLFNFGKVLIGIYLGQTAAASSYGAAGSLAVLLIWLYYSAQIFLYGAELTKAYTDRHGGSKPTENAEPVTEEDRAKEGISVPKQEKVGAAS